MPSNQIDVSATIPAASLWPSLARMQCKIQHYDMKTVFNTTRRSSLFFVYVVLRVFDRGRGVPSHRCNAATASAVMVTQKSASLIIESVLN